MPIAPQVILLLAILVGAQCRRLVNAHIAKVSERALLEQQDVSEKWEDDTDYMQDGPTEEPGDVVPEYRSKQTRNGITSTYAIGKSKAYSARLSDSLRDSIRSMKEVKYVKRNQEVTAAGLVRTTIRDRSNNSPDYVYGNSGEGVNIYIIDSGINIGNAEFENRASWGTDFVEPNNSPMSDPNGHGTNVAGFAMSKTFGIAKKAAAVAVRVLSATRSGTTTNVIRGIQWATSQHSTGQKSIINLSLSGPKSQAVNDVVQAATNKPFHFLPELPRRLLISHCQSVLCSNIQPQIERITVWRSKRHDIPSHHDSAGYMMANPVMGPTDTETFVGCRVLEADSSECQVITSKFYNDWVKGECSKVDIILNIFCPGVLTEMWEVRRASLANKHSPTAVEQHYHGTIISCDIIRMVDTQLMWKSTTMALPSNVTSSVPRAFVAIMTVASVGL
eukprot:Em0001g2214a